MFESESCTFYFFDGHTVGYNTQRYMTAVTAWLLLPGGNDTGLEKAVVKDRICGKGPSPPWLGKSL